VNESVFPYLQHARQLVVPSIPRNVKLAYYHNIAAHFITLWFPLLQQRANFQSAFLA